MSVQAVFNETAKTYDEARRRLIPCFDRFYGAALELLPSDAERVLELGAGTGLFSAMLRAHMPGAELTLVDVAEAMLEQARERLGTDGRMRFLAGDYAAIALPEAQDVVASALSIHHLEDGAKQALFGRVLRCLRPGGLFVNADQVAGVTAGMETEYVRRWLAAVRACGATEQQIRDSLYRQQEDRRASVEAQLGWLRAAGFDEVDCWFKEGSFAVFVGRRSALRETARQKE